MEPGQAANEKKKPFKEPRTKWRNSKAKIQAYDDIMARNIPLEAEADEDVMVYYYSRREYQKYDPDRFEERLNSLRYTILNRDNRAREDLEAYTNFLLNHEPSVMTQRGNIQWQNSEAQYLLLQDIDDELHLSMSKKELYLSSGGPCL